MHLVPLLMCAREVCFFNDIETVAHLELCYRERRLGLLPSPPQHKKIVTRHERRENKSVVRSPIVVYQTNVVNTSDRHGK